MEGELVVRRRKSVDLPALERALLAQQAETRYPFRDPLPIPVADFLHLQDAQAAWTATLDGVPVGHACRTGPGIPEQDAPAAAAHGCEVGELSWVSSLFTAREVRGRGLGRRLLETVVADIRAADLRPCLEVLPVHAAAFAMYQADGWREVARTRPPWLDSTPGSDGLEVRVLVLPQAGGCCAQRSGPKTS